MSSATETPQPAGRSPLARLRRLQHGFQPSFWVANFSETFERLAFYGQQAFLALFLVQQAGLSVAATGALMGWFGLLVYALPVVMGTLADRFGFRASLTAAYIIAGIGYFLLGSVSAPWMQPVRAAVPLYWLLFAILAFTACGPALVKPCVAGTVAVSSSEEARATGYSIYYTLVNIGGALGPLIAAAVFSRAGMEAVFRVSAFEVFAMAIAVVVLFRNPPRALTQSVTTLRQSFVNIGLVLVQWRFVIFLILYSGLYLLLFAFYVVMPPYFHEFITPSPGDAAIARVLSAESFMIIAFQVLATHLTRRVRTFTALIFAALASTAAMLVMNLQASLWVGVAAMCVYALGELVQAPRYYEYVSLLAPPGREGLFLGYAFVPIALGYFGAGQIGGRLLHYYGEVVHRPQEIWYALAAIGLLTAVLLFAYDRLLVRTAPARSAA